MEPLVWQPYFPVVPLLSTAAVAAALAVLAYRRSGMGRGRRAGLLCGIRLTVLLVLTVLLLGPSRLPEQLEEPGRTCLEIWMDTSGSMATEDMDGASRYRFAVEHWLNESGLAALSEDFEVSLVGFDESPREISRSELEGPAAEKAAGERTLLVDSLYRRISAYDPDTRRAVLLLSDGHDSDDRSPAMVIEAARRRDIPVHTVPLGGPRLERDLYLLALPQQDYLIAGEEGRLDVRIMQANAGQAQSTLRVTSGGERSAYPVVFNGEPSATVSLPIRHEEAGLYEYVLSVDSVPGEVEERNNHQTLYVEVSPKRFRILLLEGEPYWDTKFLAYALRHDERVELVQISQISEARRETLVTRVEGGDSRLPDTLEDLAAYDIVILGRSIEHVTGTAWLSMLPEYVSLHGGRLILSRGRFYQPDGIDSVLLERGLNVLDPVTWTGERIENVRLALDPIGRMHPALRLAETEQGNDEVFEQMPVLDAGWVAVPKAATQVLAHFEEADGSTTAPALVTMDYGAGMVMAVLGEGLWRWRLLGLEEKEFAGIYEQLWGSLVRWMVSSGDFQPGHDIGLRLTPRHARKDEPVTVHVLSRFRTEDDQAMRLRIIDPERNERELALRAAPGSVLRRQASFTPEIEGVYRLVLDAPGMKPERLESRFDVYAMDAERLRSSAHPGVMHLLARETGGAFLNPYDSGKLASTLRKRETARVVPRRPEYVWDRGWIMVCLLLAAGAEWIARKRWGWV